MKKYIIIILLILTVSFLAYCFLSLINYDWSKKPWRIFIKDRNWIIITDKANEFWYKKEIEIDFNSQFVKDLLNIEDNNYYSHLWIDIISKLWALKSNILEWKIVSWWSTITEQYIKNKYFQNNKRTILQKLREAILALYFSLTNKKNIILSYYLNNIYFWNNIYWIWWAIETYFWKTEINELTHEEITLLISLIHNPWVQSLSEKNFRQYFNKIKNKLWYNFDITINKLNTKENIDRFPFVTINKNKFLLEKNIVSVDSELQQYAKDILNTTLDKLVEKNVTNWAIFAMNPKTQEILIYQWSRDFFSKEIDGQVDVIQSNRQMWSTLKPFLYLMALENWANPDDLILDLENQYNTFDTDEIYVSNNYSLKEYWLVRFKKALWNSLNNASVRLASELWLEKVYNYYKDYWFNLPESSDYYWYSLVLWNPSIKLVDLVMSYSKLLPNLFQSINQETTSSQIFQQETTSSQPSPLEEKEQDQIINLMTEDEVLENQTKFLLYDILSDPDNRDISFWVNSILNTSIYQAVKTWTSTDFRDNVIVSYHPDFVIWIWVGNNDNSSMIWVTWITWAGYIWHQIIEKAIELWYINNQEISVPEWIEQSSYCLDEKCFRKELIYKKQWKEYFSRLLEWKYSSKDLYEKLNSEEIERLKDFEIYLGE